MDEISKIDILFVKSTFKKRIWGSDYFKTKCNLTTSDENYGEYWSLSAHNDGESIIDGGPLANEPLSKVYRDHRALFKNFSSDTFPVMVKMIASNDDLSVQVHPDDNYAQENENSRGKTECWYIIEAEQNSHIIYGHNALTKSDLIYQVNAHQYESLFIKKTIHQGDFVFVPAGMVHALGKGIVLLEIQQSSDITYRIYDYLRKDANGNERTLHIDKALDVITVPSPNIEILNLNSVSLINESYSVMQNPFFQVNMLRIKAPYTFNNVHHQAYIVSIASGSLSIHHRTLHPGESFIITSQCDSFTFTDDALCFITSV